MVARLPSSRLIIVAGLVTLALAACGRRGALEAPSSAAAQAEAQQGTVPSPVGTPRRSRSSGYTVPNRPFILDPLL